MIVRPNMARRRAYVDAEPVETSPPSASQTGGVLSPPVEPSSSPLAQSAAPALSAAASPLNPSTRRGRTLSFSLLLALASSLAVHAAVLAYLGERVVREGVETTSEAISVEIILDAPPSRPTKPVEGEAAAPAQQEIVADEPRTQGPAESVVPKPVEPVEADTALTPPPAEETASAAAETIPPAERKPAEAAKPRQAVPTKDDVRDVETDKRQATSVEDVPPQPAEDLSRMDTAPEAEEAPQAVAALALPRDNIPIPTPRPKPPPAKAQAPAKPARNAAPAKSVRKAVQEKPAPQQTTAAPAKPAAKNQMLARSPAVNAGRRGGATAGEKAAYARRLLSHVERHQRYPPEAARQGIAGAAGLSITIDRQGRLADARLSRGSGHAILDREALAVARRAAPYPRPPEGIAGATLNFSVTLRFKR